MTLRFVARTAGVDMDPDGYSITAGLAEHDDGTGFNLLFMCDGADPDPLTPEMGMDTHCLVTGEQEGTAYGCVREVTLTGNVLRIVLAPEALPDLNLDDSEIEATLQVSAADLDRFREVLAHVLAYGRADAKPVSVSL
ncbi:Imm10 family immunity protein [Nocardia brasiliensis]|uniref:Imm10 family immunity protein n=1 Tax=Nocardia brasiliensis TaxID=37326 RepID=UPI003D8AA361